ncbi:MAG: branched-chain amino acid ABC transporter substrate-binding protein [Pseudohongiellaceae bacterium]|nr:branched-chain amino acid ABC transporter substrate-binding protein [Pseudohongiellaceae bacterium]
MKKISVLSATIGLCFTASFASFAQEPIRIAYIEPLSGAFSATGYNAYVQFKFAFDTLVNDAGGVLGGRPIELVQMDNQNSAQESQIQLRRAIGEGIGFILQGSSSAVAGVLTQALKRHNRRNPDQQVLFFNYAAVDPALSNENCSFWHFRFDAHADMKMQALTDLMAESSTIKRVYIIGQDYSFGQAVADSAVAQLAEKRPDIEVVGNELHPMGTVKDFTPYVTKIVAAKPDAIITGNWGADMVSLARAISDAGLDTPVYTYYAAYDGITATIGDSGAEQFHMIHEGYFNPAPSPEYADYVAKFKQQYPDNDINYPRIIATAQMIARAIEEAGSTDAEAVALALEGMVHTNIFGKEVFMRADDHQLFQDLQISVHTNQNIVFDADNSGWGMRTERSSRAKDTVIDHSCRMRRP